MRTWMHRGLAPLLAPGRGTYGSVVSRFSALQKTDKNIEMAANASVFRFRLGVVRGGRAVAARLLPGSCPVSARFLPGVHEIC